MSVICWFTTNQQSLCGGGYPSLPLLLERLLLKLVRDKTFTYVEFRSNTFYLLSSSASGCSSPYLLGHSQMWWFFFSSTANITVAGTWNLPVFLGYWTIQCRFHVQNIKISTIFYLKVYFKVYCSDSFFHFQLLFLNHLKSRKSSYQCAGFRDGWSCIKECEGWLPASKLTKSAWQKATKLSDLWL